MSSTGGAAGHCGLNAVWLQQDARGRHRAPARRHGHQLRHAHAGVRRHHALALTLLSCWLLCEMALTLLNDCSAVRRSTQSDCGAHGHGSAACMTPACITLTWTFIICHLPGHQVLRDPAVLSGRGHELRPAAVTARRHMCIGRTLCAASPALPAHVQPRRSPASSRRCQPGNRRSRCQVTAWSGVVFTGQPDCMAPSAHDVSAADHHGLHGGPRRACAMAVTPIHHVHLTLQAGTACSDGS